MVAAPCRLSQASLSVLVRTWNTEQTALEPRAHYAKLPTLLPSNTFKDPPQHFIPGLTVSLTGMNHYFPTGGGSRKPHYYHLVSNGYITFSCWDEQHTPVKAHPQNISSFHHYPAPPCQNLQVYILMRHWLSCDRFSRVFKCRHPIVDVSIHTCTQSIFLPLSCGKAGMKGKPLINSAILPQLPSSI